MTTVVRNRRKLVREAISSKLRFYLLAFLLAYPYLKVVNHLRFGFAAGCDGGYAPPKTGQIIPGYALGSDLGLQIYWAKSCTKGIAQEWKGNLYGGAKPPPQNPGGKAETQMANYFEKVTSICTIS